MADLGIRQGVPSGGRERMASTASDLLEGGVSHVNSRFDLKTFMPERVNAEISKRYDIDQREIGSGGYGKVFVAKDREMKNRLVAIKKVIIHDQEKKKAFQKEIDIMKALDHPNICKLLETYEQGRFMFFVMEFCEGREVFDRIMDHGMIAEKTTKDIVRQSASALNYAHNKGIAHRDMKPENICFCTNDPHDNHIKVIDWGLGFYFGQARMVSAVGSLTYAAPEVLEARELDGYTSACDLWSLGVVTYVMLCGKPPFWGNFNEQLKRMKKETYPMTDSTWQGVSKEAKDLIRSLLKNSPKDRLALEGVLKHPWLKSADNQIDSSIGREVLSNMKQFCNTSQFFSLCVASVARQLDHRSLRDVHRVFCDMDANGDGVLELHEVKAGFEKIFGKGSEQVRDVEQMFERLDLDGSGTIDYTEFCAAGIGERLSTEDHVLWAAFKAFDIHDDDGRITRDEIKQVLVRADVNKFWTTQICDELSHELFARYDKDKDGSIDFEEFKKLMNETATRHSKNMSNVAPQERALLAEIPTTPADFSINKTYDILVELDRPTGEGSPRAVGRNRRAAIEEVSPQRRTGAHAVSGSLYAMTVMHNNTPSCFTCSPGHRDSKCTVQ
mmetsp:Transcript_16931/g.43149  ORF Transcript_16931/g.43149 Transcript_16931/m.43149 type:complete len:614 (+) Transcript_16931:105-1946(+)